MNDKGKVTLIFVKDTGNVLAAVSHAADPETPLKAEQLAVGGLLLRGVPGAAGKSFTVPADELDALDVDLEELLLLSPREYRALLKDKKAVNVASANALPPSLTVSLVLHVNKATFSLGAAPTEDQQVWALIDFPSSSTRAIRGQILKASAPAAVDVTLPEPLQFGSSQRVLLLTEGAPLRTSLVNVLA